MADRCKLCCDAGWVCENHPGRPWGDYESTRRLHRYLHGCGGRHRPNRPQQVARRG